MHNKNLRKHKFIYFEKTFTKRKPKNVKCKFTLLKKVRDNWPQFRLDIVLSKSLRNSKRRNKGNFTSKSNSNKIKLCGDGGQH